ncbi:hypothetical protein Bca52824_036854 [Brassica carinata]|uniref:Uncharacterized protein n=1 Tax=Brassica carinata TaxID=52824 RepID=A0A8X7S5P7_BRACI|nr:hypothetical protein Bca52824_036854 [Brassica carinata]
MNAERSSLMEENYLLTAFELLHELLDDGRDAQTILLKEFFSDPIIPLEIVLVSRCHVITKNIPCRIHFADPQSLLEEKEALSEKLAISEYEFCLAQEDITRSKTEGQKRPDCSIDKLEAVSERFGSSYLTHIELPAFLVAVGDDEADLRFLPSAIHPKDKRPETKNCCSQ